MKCLINLIKSFVVQRTHIRIKQFNSTLIVAQKRPFNDSLKK
jgi:hypothetical protein